MIRSRSSIGEARSIFPALLCLLASACATLPDNDQGSPSRALDDTAGTRLGMAIQGPEREHAGESGFILLGDGLDAFTARAALAMAAERSIDLQYYLYHDDLVGHLLTHQLLRAADRGVRVRALIDDMDMKGRDPLLASLDAHPNIEIRLFNPFSRRAQRTTQLLTRFGEVTRRMHNKSFTVDNQVTVVGGRNIGNEYFSADPDFAFGDLDVMAVGPVVQQVSESFDLYWNHQLAYPVAVLAEDKFKLLSADEVQSRVTAFEQANQDSPYVTRLRNSPLATAIAKQTLTFNWGEAQAVYDAPDKLLQATDQRQFHLSPQLKPYVSSLQDELIVFAAYFVPGKAGVAFFRNLRERGVRVRILTNSLASTDVAAVHSGYARYRKELLRAGVELYEAKATTATGEPSEVQQLTSSQASLHAKAFVMDRKQVFIGSFNLDPRSDRENTEIGIVFESSKLGAGLAEAFDDIVHRAAYRLTLDERSRLVWHDDAAGDESVLSVEPETSWFQRFSVSLMRLLPIESQL